VRALVAELIGTFALVFAGAGAIMVDDKTHALGHVGVAINTIGGKLVLLESTGPVGNWLDVALSGFHPDSVVTVVLPDGKKLVQEIHAGSSYLSSEDPRAHFGLAGATKVKELTVRWPDGTETHERNIAANQIVTVKP